MKLTSWMDVRLERISESKKPVGAKQLSSAVILRKIFFLSTIVFLSFFTQPGRAGEKLFLQTGKIDPKAMMGRSGYSSPLSKSKSVYVVQFTSEVLLSDRTEIEGLGGEILRYIPDDALAVSISSSALKSLRAKNTRVRAWVPYQPSWKISRELGPANVFSAFDHYQVLIRFFPGKTGSTLRASLEAVKDVSVEFDSADSLVVTATRRSLERIAENDDVEWIQINPKMELFYFSNLKATADSEQESAEPMSDYTELTGYETGTKLMNFSAAWSRGWNGRGQFVAMADTGLDSGNSATIHSDFHGRIGTGFVFGLFSKSWEDPMGHGTHVAGSVLGSGASSQNLLAASKVTPEFLSGGAPEATMIPEGMWSPMLNNLTVPPKLAQLFQKAYSEGARIHTNSWGSPRNLGAYDSFAQQTDEFIASHPDMLILFAAGNSGVDDDKDGRIDPNSIGSPGTAKNVLTVGASKNYVMSGGIQKRLSELKIGQEHWGKEPLASSMLSENAQGLAPFSSRGPTLDGRIKPEIVAPGTNILSTRSHHPKAELLWGAYNDQYLWSGGTSMATPLAAGAAAVVRQYLVEDRGIPEPSAALMKGVLMHTAFDLYPGQFGEIGKSNGQELLKTRPNSDEGYGRVDVDRATSLAGVQLIDEKKGVAVGENLRFPIQLADGITGENSVRVLATLVYTDRAASQAATKTLVNDLDLVVVDSSGKEVALNDHVNNSEQISTVLSLKNGSQDQVGYVEVRGKNVPEGFDGRQPFALVISTEL